VLFVATSRQESGDGRPDALETIGQLGDGGRYRRFYGVGSVAVDSKATSTGETTTASGPEVVKK